ncbi:hypothetical protein SprV_0100162500 [Sparganum proliferum]
MEISLRVLADRGNQNDACISTQRPERTSPRTDRCGGGEDWRSHLRGRPHRHCKSEKGCSQVLGASDSQNHYSTPRNVPALLTNISRADRSRRLPSDRCANRPTTAIAVSRNAPVPTLTPITTAPTPTTAALDPRVQPPPPSSLQQSLRLVLILTAHPPHTAWPGTCGFIALWPVHKCPDIHSSYPLQLPILSMHILTPHAPS